MVKSLSRNIWSRALIRFCLFLSFGIFAISPISSKPTINNAFAVGEELKFEMGWKAATAGTATLRVQEIAPRKKRPCYRLVCEASSNQAIDLIYPVRDRFESWMDVETMCSVGFARRINEGTYMKNEDTFIDPVTGKFQIRKIRFDKKSTPQMSTGQFPRRVQDFVSAVYFVRAQPLKPGDTFSLKVANGEEVEEIKVKILRKEATQVPAGSFPCLVLEPLFRFENEFKPHPKASVNVWLTDDPRHLPVKIVVTLAFGEISAQLKAYKIPPVVGS